MSSVLTHKPEGWAGRARRWLYVQLEPSARVKGLSPINKYITGIILGSIILAVVSSEPVLNARWEPTFGVIEGLIGVLFSIEYVCRLWAAGENPAYGGGIRGKILYAVSPHALVDLIAVMPLFFPGMGSEYFMLRLMRLIRVLRIARFGRFSDASTLLINAIRSRSFELMLSAVVGCAVMLITSTLLYVVEGDLQPEQFGSIPRAMWWSVATLTTVGYGDVTPVTVLGRIIAGLTAIAGIGVIAIPTGILAAAFSNAVQQHKSKTGLSE